MATTNASLPGPALRGVKQIAVVAHDVPRATRFYRDVLGLPLLFEAPPGLAFFDCGGVRLMVSLPEGVDAAGASALVYYDVADIHVTHDTLRARGVQFAGDPHVVASLGDRDVWLAELRDSEGNRLALMSEAPRAATAATPAV
jgi:predicted enzyme related to lactoylglutathione lyase